MAASAPSMVYAPSMLRALSRVVAFAASARRPVASRLVIIVGALALVASVGGCAHDPPIKSWQRGYYTRRSMRFDDGLEGKFRQHLFGAREGAEGGYGQVGGGCGCN